MRILWLKSEFLHPVDKGGRIRTYQMLRALARHHEIRYLTLDDGCATPAQREQASEYAAEVVTVPFAAPVRGTGAFFADLARNLFSPLPYAIAKYRVPAFTEAIGRHAAEADVLVCDFLAPAVNLPDRLPVPSVLFQHNVEAEIWRRHAEVAGSAIARQYFRSQWRRMVRFEGEACRRFDKVVAVSDQDAEHLRAAYGARDVTAVPTGVDLDYFEPASRTAPRATELVFTGSMDWLPNQDGIEWFTAEVWPQIRAGQPDATLTVVGRNPGPRIRALADRHPGISVTGTVPDIRPYLRRAAALVVPLRIGGGTRLKIYEAMAMGVPVVSTTVGAEGLPLTEGAHFLNADDPADLGSACLSLLKDPAKAMALGAAGAAFVRSRFGWDRVAESFAAICEAAADPARLQTQGSQG
jgi:sugar transferase (PEP-CTERM/EpsH1 system associated)